MVNTKKFNHKTNRKAVHERSLAITTKAAPSQARVVTRFMYEVVSIDRNGSAPKLTPFTKTKHIWINGLNGANMSNISIYFKKISYFLRQKCRNIFVTDPIHCAIFQSIDFFACIILAFPQT